MLELFEFEVGKSHVPDHVDQTFAHKIVLIDLLTAKEVRLPRELLGVEHPLLAAVDLLTRLVALKLGTLVRDIEASVRVDEAVITTEHSAVGVDEGEGACVVRSQVELGRSKGFECALREHEHTTGIAEQIGQLSPRKLGVESACCQRRVARPVVFNRTTNRKEGREVAQFGPQERKTGVARRTGL